MASNLTHPNIQFHFLEPTTLKDRTYLKTFISNLFKKEKMKLTDIQYIFCSDEYLLDINRQHLQHDYYTDIITFGLSEPGHPITAEIYISVDRVKDNAANFDVTFTKELHRVIFHGALHLCGYKDKSKKDAELMRKMEEKYLSLYFSA